MLLLDALKAPLFNWVTALAELPAAVLSVSADLAVDQIAGSAVFIAAAAVSRCSFRHRSTVGIVPDR
jgi:hypothetical protein